MKGISTFSKPPVFGSMLLVQGEDFYKIPKHFCADVQKSSFVSSSFFYNGNQCQNSPSKPHSVGWCLPVGCEGWRMEAWLRTIPFFKCVGQLPATSYYLLYSILWLHYNWIRIVDNELCIPSIFVFGSCCLNLVRRTRQNPQDVTVELVIDGIPGWFPSVPLTLVKNVYNLNFAVRVTVDWVPTWKRCCLFLFFW